jgi:hypothetical protein
MIPDGCLRLAAVFLLLGSTGKLVSSTNNAETLLQPADFPINFVNMSHPDDYKLLNAPLAMEYIFHRSEGNSRFIVQISFLVEKNKYLPMSFIVDTGCPIGFTFSRKATQLLEQYKRSKEDELGKTYISVFLGNESMQTHEGHFCR